MSGIFSQKSDVYSFGVLVLEIISSKKNTTFYIYDRQLGLLAYAWQLWKEGRELELVDEMLAADSYSAPEVMKCVHIGLLCVQDNPTDRPSMPDVIFMLNGSTNVIGGPQPKQPLFTIQNSLEHQRKELNDCRAEVTALYIVLEGIWEVLMLIKSNLCPWKDKEEIISLQMELESLKSKTTKAHDFSETTNFEKESVQMEEKVIAVDEDKSVIPPVDVESRVVEKEDQSLAAQSFHDNTVEPKEVSHEVSVGVLSHSSTLVTGDSVSKQNDEPSLGSSLHLTSENLSPENILADALPKIVPYVLINHRELISNKQAIKIYSTTMMKSQVASLLGLTMAILFFSGARAAKITFTNNCPNTVWPGTLTGDQKPQLSLTGFELASKANRSVDAPSPWSGRFWGRTRCSTDAAGKFSCETADCGSGQVACNGTSAAPPATVVEIKISEKWGQDLYDVTLVDGFNLPISVAPQGGTSECMASTCDANVNAACPAELQVKAVDGSVISCKSACMAFNEPKYCCTASNDTCQPTEYSQILEQHKKNVTTMEHVDLLEFAKLLDHQSARAEGLTPPTPSPLYQVPNPSDGKWSRGNWREGVCGKPNRFVRETNKLVTLRGKENDDDDDDDGFLKLVGFKVPDSHEFVSLDSDSTSADCKTVRLNNCSYQAYALVYKTRCLVWSKHLIHVEKFPSDGVDVYIHLARAEPADELMILVLEAYFLVQKCLKP
ncbi:hypothetical protein COP1_025631 [Malus domestica]